ncbi:MAG: two-component sensor histidine kinase [Nocardioidaceae bacterium]|nr:two-component sensor histidine kinase [Nocardioidaceae bacterium]
MDPTTQMGLAALAGSLLTGAAALAWVVSDRQMNHTEPRDEPIVPVGVDAVLAALRSSAVLLDEHDVVVRASPPAYALGLVKGHQLVVPELLDLAREVRRDGEIRTLDLELSTPGVPPRSVSARVAPLGPRLILALADDRTRERRLEAVRRDFVANVSHELKTPVGAVQLLAEASRGAADDPQAVEKFSKRILKETKRLSRLVQQIIDLSRLQGDDPLESPMTVSIDKVVEAAVDTSFIDAEARAIEMTVQGEAGLEVSGNEEQVTAAVSNLVANAVAYSPEGSSVTVQTSSTPNEVNIAVIDKGIGIPAREIDRIFERFYRVDPARHRSTGGTGLGLSIVKHIAATHGGDVTVWSVEGQGSTFTLVLPRITPEEDQ